MNTPIFDFVSEYTQKNASRMHMPGHKGNAFLGCESMDITEIPGADVLHHATGIIRESEETVASLFGSGATFFSTEGSSLCIKAMLDALVQAAYGKEICPVIVAARNIHRSMVDACALLDLDIRFVKGSNPRHICTSRLTPENLHRELSVMDKRPLGVYVTSPDYLGEMQDIAGLARVCREFCVPLVVDNAHGAYLRFLEPSRHPITLGAAMCCDSAHKTLPVLTGGAYLHVAEEFVKDFAWRIPGGMALFGSTSPSYLLLQSLDLCNRYLADGYRERLKLFVARLEQCRNHMQQCGFVIRESEALKITIEAANMGVSGESLAEKLRVAGIECEYSDRDYVVLMLTPENTEEDIQRLERFADAYREKGCYTDSRQSVNREVKEKCQEGSPSPATLYMGEVTRACSIREAVFAPGEEIPVEEAVGRILGAETVSCPPAIPIAICGERITHEMVRLFQRYGISTVTVLKGSS
ncbi:MAG: amino acid decarboxylase [Lachnospiraceae bacterium]|nr:amino acid decarboxylase [Lachnospiraceae bacterium]